MTLGIMRFLPFIAEESFTIGSLILGTTAASANAQIAIYASDATTHLPTGAALGSTASIVAATTPVSAAMGGNVALVKGKLYYLVANLSANTSCTAALGSNGNGNTLSNEIGDATAINVFSIGYTLAQTFATWPTVTSSTFVRVGGGTIPVMGYKVVSVP